MNRICLVGNLTRDPELKRVGDEERAVCELRVAVSNGRDREPTYVDVSTFDGSAEACAEHLRKGRRVGVDGRLIHQEWEAADGTKRQRHAVIGRVDFLDRPSASASPTESEDSEGEDVPF